MTDNVFAFQPAVRRNTHLLIAIAGPSGAGKTYSALEMATGLAGQDGKIAVIDTEAGRALHYADRFRFDHCDLKPPFSPDRYIEAIEAASRAGYAVIVIDSMSHEHEGEGGLIEMAEAELKKPNMKSPANWAAPKAKHKRMMNRLLQIRAHLVFCLRADEKIRLEMIEDERNPGRKKAVVVPLGWMPICEKRFMYEMTCSFIVEPDRPGVPRALKLQEQHRAAFPQGERISRESGRILAEWAAGGAPSLPATRDLRGEAREAAARGRESLRTFWRALSKADRASIQDILDTELVPAADAADQEDNPRLGDDPFSAAERPASEPDFVPERDSDFWGQERLIIAHGPMSPGEFEHAFRRYLRQALGKVDLQALEADNADMIESLPRATREEIGDAIRARAAELAERAA
jgi:hypothetical protein